MVAIALVSLALFDGGYYPRALGTATLLVWSLALIPLAIGLWPRDRVPRTAIAAGCTLAALTLLIALSLGWGHDSGSGFIEVVRGAGYTGLFAVVVLASRRGEARAWIAGMTIAAVAIAILALFGRFQPSLFDQGTVELANSLPSARSRLSFPIGYWNGLAAVAAVATSLLVWWWANGDRAWSRIAALALVPAAALVLFLTSSRGGVLAALIGLAVIVAIGPHRTRTLAGLAVALVASAVLIALADSRSAFVDGLADGDAASQGDQMMLIAIAAVALSALAAFAIDRPLGRLKAPRWLGWAALGAFVAIALGGFVAADPGERLDRFRQPPAVDGSDPAAGASHLASDAGSGRWQFWEAGIDAFRSEPLHGIGAAGYGVWWNEHGELTLAIRDAHSWPVETLAELGLLGGLLGFGFVAIVIVGAGRRIHAARDPDALAVIAAPAAVFVAVLASAAIDWIWELPGVFSYLIVAAGALCGAAVIRPAADAGAHLARPRRGAGFGWGVATLAFGLAAIWVAGVLYLAEGKLADSRAAVDAGRRSDAAGDAVDAATIEPWAAEPRLQLALVRERDGDLRGARRSLAAALARAPRDWSLWVVAARIDLRLGAIERARSEIDEARRLNPKATFLGEVAAVSPGDAE